MELAKRSGPPSEEGTEVIIQIQLLAALEKVTRKRK
jgi:hypothetical protein